MIDDKRVITIFWTKNFWTLCNINERSERSLHVWLRYFKIVIYKSVFVFKKIVQVFYANTKLQNSLSSIIIKIIM